MIANDRYVINRTGSVDKELILPLELNWDFSGKDNSIELYEEDVAQEIVGSAIDYDVVRFAHKGLNEITDLNYNFNFYFGGSLSDQNNWKNSFLSEFTVNDIFYNSESFNGSFFKIDLYDTITDKRQKNYLTIIINPNKSKVTDVDGKKINYPSYKLDYGLNSEGFYIYWLSDYSILNINTLYMSCKFYNAKTGSFTRMMNTPQSKFSDKHNFDSTKYFYQKIVFDYVSKTYNIFDLSDNLIGSASSPINWFEYVNL